MIGTKTQSGVVGVTVRDDGVQVLRLHRQRGYVALDGYGTAPLAGGVVDSGVVNDTARLADAIRTACDAAVPRVIARGTHAVLTIPETKTFIRILSLPQLEPDKMAAAVRWEIEGYIPMPVDDVYYDWQVVETIPPQQKGHVAVLVVAAARSVVDAYIAAADAAGLYLVGIEPDSVADVRALAEPSWRDNGTIILWCGTTQSRLSIVIGGVPIFTVSLPIGRATLRADVERAFGTNTAEAQRIMENGGIGSYVDRDPLFAAVEPAIGTLAEEIRRSASFCIQSMQHCDGINRIVLCGTGATLKGLRAFLVRQTGFPVVVADPWRNVPLSPGTIPSLPRTAALDAVSAIGLALRNFTYADFS